jgi:hypothetical protein
MGLLPPIIAFSAISIVCLAFIAVAMAKEEGTGKGILGFVTVIYALLWGVQNRRRIRIGSFGLDDVTTILAWSFSMVVVLSLLADKL